jgi:hypothetical protein
MNRFFQILSPRAFSLIFAASVAGLTACDTGKDPTEHNDNGRKDDTDTTTSTSKNNDASGWTVKTQRNNSQG